MNACTFIRYQYHIHAIIDTDSHTTCYLINIKISVMTHH